MERVNSEVGVDTLSATTTTATFRERIDRFGDVTLRPRSIPIQSVTSVRYRYHPSQAWTTVPSDYIEVVDERDVAIRSLSLGPLIDGQPLDFGVYRLPAEVDRQRKFAVTFELTYTSGYNVIPEFVKTATVLYAVSLLLERGAQSVTANGTPSVMGGSPYDNSLEKQAKALLRRLKRGV